MLPKDRTRNASEQVSSAIFVAATGRGSWRDVCSSFTEAFPGSYAALLNQDFTTPEVSFAVADGLDQRHLESFLTHYSYVNPWRRFWQYAKNGAILVAERDDPARRYHDSEFYNDWMRAVGDFDAAVGLRLQASDDQVIYLPVHFSERLSGEYSSTLELVMESARSSLINAMQIADYLKEITSKTAARSALVSRERSIAFIIDDRMRLIEANHLAVAAFSHDFPVGCRHHNVYFASSPFTTAFVDSLRSRQAQFTAKKLLQAKELQWIVMVNQIPATFETGLMPSRDQFLVQIHQLTPHNEHPDEEILIKAYGLTLSELRLCRSLSAGLMLAEAAAANRISYETSRQKLKSIFQKTGLSSQADLKSLLRVLV
ncbi:hypothetical protein RGK87_24645 [Agrobacterium fabacearum]|uniref:helix-turn-helix transcriptional regulator n=1 Tax=Agrobacterium tumefaciens TaxID=358 RepID=UPI0028532EBD|nr:hypothetical protein [Agrobacterium tumefaciens]MDR5012212.1 hypothetical protein [Agrobacterium tumefaciens]